MKKQFKSFREYVEYREENDDSMPLPQQPVDPYGSFRGSAAYRRAQARAGQVKGAYDSTSMNTSAAVRAVAARAVAPFADAAAKKGKLPAVAQAARLGISKAIKFAAAKNKVQEPLETEPEPMQQPQVPNRP